MVLNNRGQSLTSILVIVGLASISTMALTSLFTSSSKGQTSVASLDSIESTRMQVEQLMHKNEECTKILFGKEFDPASPIEKKISGLTIAIPGSPHVVFAAPGMGIGFGTETRDVELDSFQDLNGPNGDFSARLRLSFDRKGLFGGEHVSRNLAMFLQTEPTPSLADSPTRRRILACDFLGKDDRMMTRKNGFTQFRVFFNSGSFTVPAKTSLIKIEVWGAGGGGGSAYKTGGDCAAGGGGAAGGYAMSILEVSPQSNYPITVGAGGAGGAYPNSPAAVFIPAQSLGDGFGGGDSDFNGIVKATGGHGGYRGRPDVPGGQAGFGGYPVGEGFGMNDTIAGGFGYPGEYNYGASQTGLGGIGGKAGKGAGDTGAGGNGGHCHINNAQGGGLNGFPGRVVVWW